MSQKIREEMLPRLRQRHANRGSEGRSRLIDEVCEQFGYSRKHTIKLLNGNAGWGGQNGVRRGRPHLDMGGKQERCSTGIWKAAEQPCGKCLAAMVPLWLPH